jgi:hypothetical protein
LDRLTEMEVSPRAPGRWQIGKLRIAIPLAALSVLLLVSSQSIATHVRPKAATPVYASVVPAYEPCAAPNRVHAAPLSYSSCNPPVPTSPNITVGTPDANGAAANSVGFIKLIRSNGPGTNDSDLAITAIVTDVRCQGATVSCASANAAAGPDFAGALLGMASLNITDHNNAPTPAGPFTDPATGTQPSFPIVAMCSLTASTAIGATCSAHTTLMSIAPGAVVEGKRAVLEISQLRVFDGGPDGSPNNGNESLFEVQGIFIP